MLKKDLINLFKKRSKYKCYFNFKIQGLRVDILIPKKKIIVQFLSPVSYCNTVENLRIKNIKKLRNYKVITIPYFLPLTNIILKMLFNRILTYYRSQKSITIDFHNIYPISYCDSGISNFINDLDKFWFYRNEIIEYLQDAVITSDIFQVLPFCLHRLLFYKSIPKKYR